MHRVHHVQCGAAGVNGLLIAALTALTHADRPRHRRAVWRHRERQLPAALCHSHAPRASRAVRSRWREWAADCRPYGLDARRSAAAPKGCCACHAVLCQLLNKSKWCSQLWCSDSGFDAGRLAIAGTDSNCSWTSRKPYCRCRVCVGGLGSVPLACTACITCSAEPLA